MDGLQTTVIADNRAAFALPPLPAAGPRIAPHVFLGMVRAAEAVAMLATGAAMSLVTAGGGLSAHCDGRILLAAMLSACVADWCLRRANAYTLARLREGWRALATLALPIAVGGTVDVAALLLLDVDLHTTLVAALGWTLVAFGLLAGSRILLGRLINGGSLSRLLSRRIVVFGANAVSQRFIERLHADRASPDRVLAVFDDRRSRIPDHHAGVPVLGRIDDLLRQGRRDAIDAIVVALPLSATARLGEICDALRPSLSDIYVTADLAAERPGEMRLAHLGPNPVITVSRRPLDAWAGVQKRCLDLVVGFLLLALVAPVMGLVALAIRVESEGPALFRQSRRGLNNNDFLVYKFRTMHHHLGDFGGWRQAVRNDPRVTRVGRILRKFSFDELPQLFNVLRGDMSLVGPRPHALFTRAGDLALEDAVSDYALRHRVKPGITGWAQVNGFRGAIRNEAQLRSRVDCDLYYINNWSLWFDIKILFLTLNAKRHVRNAF